MTDPSASRVPPVRFEHGRAMLLGGLRAVHGYATAVRSIPAQWQRFVALGALPGQVGSVTYGAVCQDLPGQQGFEYLSAVEVTSFDALSPELGRMRVPAAYYAVFTHQGPVSRLRESWEAIMRDWLPSSGMTVSETPNFERYDEWFTGERADSIMEIWFPVVEER